jgi:hypothetical protein
MFRYSSVSNIPHTYHPLITHNHTGQHVMSEAREERSDDDKMSVVRSIGQKLQGRSDLYTLREKLHESVWKAT